MKKLQIFTLILFFIALTGCNIKGEYDIKGTVIEVDKAGSILVEDEKLGLSAEFIRVTLIHSMV